MCPQTLEALELFIEPDASSILSSVGRILSNKGIKSYLIGGFVRDALLKRTTADIDIAVRADALEVARNVASALNGRYVALDELNRIGRVVLFDSEIDMSRERWEIDFSTIKGTIEEDLAKRDFTIDAMAIDMDEIIISRETHGESCGIRLSSSSVIDPFKGCHALKCGVIQAVCDTAFSADPVRLLRAVRMAAELGFQLDRNTDMLIRHQCHMVSGVAGERVREELLRIMDIPGAGHLLTHLDIMGMVTAIFPELQATRGVSQPKEHFWDVFSHSIQTVVAVDFLMRQGTWDYIQDELLSVVPWSDKLEEHFNQKVSSGSTRKSLLKVAALLHDIAKPQTKAFDENGRMRFLGHGPEGAALITGILERLRFSTKEIKMVEAMVCHHLRPTQMSLEGLPTPRAIYRYFRDTGEAAIDIFFLSLADHLAARGPTLDINEWRSHAGVVDFALTRHFEEQSVATPRVLIDGNDIIAEFKLSPGPGVGQLLETVREAQAAGELSTRDEALDLIRKTLNIKENK